MGPRRAKLLLVASPGGHLFQLWALREAWEGIERTWVTLNTAEVRALLPEEDVVFAHGPTNRNVLNLLRNMVFAFRLLRRTRPLAIVTTGAGVAVPFVWIGRLFGARVVYIETLARVEGPSLSYRLAAPLVSRVYVQWPELLSAIPKARFCGTVLDRR